MTLTAYDRRQLRRALNLLLAAQRHAEWALDGNDPALRCGYASHEAHKASRLLDMSDRRIGRRGRAA